MTDDIEVVRGTGNIFRDFDRADPDLEQLRSLLAAEIIGVLDDRGLSVREAGAITGVDAGDFSRVRRAQLGRFPVDRLMKILAIGKDSCRERVCEKWKIRLCG